MFIRFKDSVIQAKKHSHYLHDITTLQEVYYKAVINDNDATKDQNGNPVPITHYLIKADKGDRNHGDCVDYVKCYGDVEAYVHPAFTGFVDNINEDNRGYKNQKYGYAYGYFWVHQDDLVEVTADNNAAYKFLLKK